MSSTPPQSDRYWGVTARVNTILLDRVTERKIVEELVSAVEEGYGRALVLHGDAGMGKTRLLEHALELVPNLRTVWISGVEAERDLGFGAPCCRHPSVMRSGPHSASSWIPPPIASWSGSLV
jgi:hypothetical protein